MNHPMIFPLNMIYSHIFPLYLSLVYDFGHCLLIGLCRFLAGAFFFSGLEGESLDIPVKPQMPFASIMQLLGGEVGPRPGKR